MRRVERIRNFILAAFALATFALPQGSKAADDRIKVVATTSIIGDLVQNVGGDAVAVTTLVGPDGDPHEFEPVPADSLKLTEANVIFANGLGLEPWLDKMTAAAQTQAAVVLVTQGINVRHAPAADGRSNPDDDRDPHAWQDVKNVVAMVEVIRAELTRLDPSHAPAYRERADAYKKQLAALDDFIQQQIQSIPPARRELVTSHDAFGYFGRRYGVDVSRSALESVTTEAADPSARQIAEVVDQIKSLGVPVIFLENIQNAALTNQIAAEANVKIGPPLYSDALGKPGSDGDTYLKMMHHNTAALVDALKP